MTYYDLFNFIFLQKKTTQIVSDFLHFQILEKWTNLRLPLNIQKRKLPFRLQRASPPWPPDQGLCPWTPLGAPPSDPRYRGLTVEFRRGSSTIIGHRHCIHFQNRRKNSNSYNTSSQLTQTIDVMAIHIYDTGDATQLLNVDVVTRRCELRIGHRKF